MSLIIKEVSTKKELKEFIKFPDNLYIGNRFYIPAIHKMELQTLFFKTNPAFEFCRTKYWLVIKGEIIVGRIAGIINDKYNKKHNTKIARFGWLDFVENENVLKLLIDTVEKWAKENNMNCMQGPLGFTSFDASGFLIEGFNEIPTSFAHYNFPYYPKLIETHGYRKDIDWVEYTIKVPDIIPEQIIKGSKTIQERYNLHQLEIKKTKDILSYADELFIILNESYKDLYAFTELSKKQINNLKKHFISLIKIEYVSIVLNNKNDLVAFGISIPSMSTALKKANGKLFPFGYFRIWKALYKNDTVDLLLIGVKPEYQNKGVHAIIFEKLGQTFKKRKIKYLETTRELENNNKVIQLWSGYEHRLHKRSRCYIKKI